jgi:hypothetical protein
MCAEIEQCAAYTAAKGDANIKRRRQWSEEDWNAGLF